MSVEVYVDERAALGEGPRWDAASGSLLWVDIDRGLVHHGNITESFGEPVGAVAPVEGGGLLVATASALVLDGQVVARFPHGADLRSNDGTCDPDGRFWIGTTAKDHRDGAGALYRFDGTLTRILDGVTISNGLGWSPDISLMYYVDTPTKRVDVFDYDGEVANRRTFAEVDGFPDGLCVDDDGGVWVAIWGGSCVRRYDADGALVHEVPVPAENPTACCFGGVDGRSLFITTAAPDGRVYVTEPGVSGPPAQPFRRTAPSEADPTSAR